MKPTPTRSLAPKARLQLAAVSAAAAPARTNERRFRVARWREGSWGTGGVSLGQASAESATAGEQIQLYNLRNRCGPNAAAINAAAHGLPGIILSVSIAWRATCRSLP